LIDEKKDWAVYINDKGSSIGKLCGFRFLKWAFVLECYICLLLNGINPFKARVITDEGKLRESDVLLAYIHYPNDLHNLKNLKGKKLLHMNHFYARLGIGVNAKMIEDADIDYFVSEADLSKNSKFFNKYFGRYNKKVLLLPYVFQERFKNAKPFPQRKNLAVATGTLARIERSKDLYDFFNIETLHPMRLAIYDNKRTLSNEVDSYIADYYEDVPPDVVSPGNRSFWSRLKKRFVMYFVMGHQKKYRSFNIVDKYNEYKMSVVPEEIIGLPAIGFVESMACGCAYIGIDDPMYRDIGLIPGKHYIAYDNTLEGLRKVIAFYQNEPYKLQMIAETGCSYVREHFNGGSAAGRFYSELTRLL
jgi:glycosyltransferase involved in cell wall biosynthesis